MLAATLDGIDHELSCLALLNSVNVYHLSTDERKAMGVKELPESLAEALGELDKDEVLEEILGQTIYEAFCRARLSEWD